ncbi:MAG: YaiO family outer membrane beta-barrel protein [Bryobacterales bacterium]|nr:YaiO family outer membrane beta-barrel protein [Bryobacterales bacterium]
MTIQAILGNQAALRLLTALVAAAGLSLCLAQNTSGVSGNPEPATADTATITSPGKAEIQPAANEQKNVHLEVGGFFNGLTNNYGSWQGGSASLTYGGLKHFTPFGSVSVQNHEGVSQGIYGGGTYINVNRWFYSIVGVSGTPQRANNIALYPNLRWDVAGMFKVPKVNGLVLSTALTEFYSRNKVLGDGGGQMITVGAMYYYKKAVFSGGISFNTARPGDIPSKSGQAGFMYGERGKYYLGGGISGGRVAYQLISTTPFDVRFNSVGTFFFVQRWIGRNWGVITRYDYQNLMEAYQRNAITGSVFFDF